MNVMTKTVLIALFLSVFCVAQGQPVIVTSVISGGGGTVTVGSYTLTHTIGQAMTGATQVGADVNAGGFWNQYAKATGPLTVSEFGFLLYSREGTPEGTVWIHAIDGSFDSAVFAGSYPRLSHNGRYVVYHKGSSNFPWFKDLYVYDRQAGRDTFLFYNGDWIQDYSWSGNDSSIVFDHGCQVQRINRDGSGLATVFAISCYDDWPMLNPGDSTIAFQNNFYGILLVDANGANRRVVPNTQGGDYLPAWSPDGQWIAFSRVAGDTLRSYYKIHPDGSGLTALTLFTGTQAAFFQGGVWTPDGTKLIVPARINATRGIYAIATDGSGNFGLIPTPEGAPIDFVGSITGNINLTLTAIHDNEHQQDVLPKDFGLQQNYPNPFNPSTTLNYALPAESKVRLTILNVLGQIVETLVDGVQQAGYRSVQWNAGSVASDVYFYRLEATSLSDPGRTFTSVKKMVVMK